jgi:hypothetical protein
VVCTPAVETTISAALLLKLLNIWPWAELLWLLRRHWRSISSLLLGWVKNQSARCDIPLRRFELRIGNNTIPWWLNTRGSYGGLPFLLSTMCHDTVFLS